MLYAAYGSNLNKAQMEERCPGSDIVATKVLKGWGLCFRGVADIVPENGSFVNLGIYKISTKCSSIWTLCGSEHKDQSSTFISWI